MYPLAIASHEPFLSAASLLSLFIRLPIFRNVRSAHSTEYRAPQSIYMHQHALDANTREISHVCRQTIDVVNTQFSSVRTNIFIVHSFGGRILISGRSTEFCWLSASGGRGFCERTHARAQYLPSMAPLSVYTR